MTWTRRRQASGAMSLACLLLLAPPVAAEVRLKVQPGAHGAGLHVQPTTRGPWTVVGAIDARTLNPEGDVIGDGYPGHAVRGDDLLVAWARPSHHALAVATRESDGWRRVVEIPTSAVAGTPRVLAAGSAWVVVWQCLAFDEPTVVMTGVSRNGMAGEPVVVAEGHLVDAVAQGESIHLVVVPAAPPALDAVVVTLSLLEGIPQPVGRVAWRLHEGQLPGQAIRIHDGAGKDGSFALATWWVTPWELRYVELSEDGPVMPVEALHARGSAWHSPALVLEAVRTVREH